MPIPVQKDIEFNDVPSLQQPSLPQLPQQTALLDALGVPASLRQFEPSYASAHTRAAHIAPSAYARTRNALDGGVTGLSPYLTHGLISLPEVARTVAAHHRLGYDDKLVFELGWREFFHHVWANAPQPDAILADMRPANVWRGQYASALPADIRQGRTGVKAIDAAVRQLYATGYVHNHARMWLASYCVHMRKAHWRAGADWLYMHLLDGDLPSNHLSWQWVAATFSSKPYLFNASNVAKFAPESAWKAWASAKSAIDMSYEQLDAVARLQADVGPEPGVHAAVEEPAVYTALELSNLDAFKPLAQVNAAQAAIQNIANRVPHSTADVAVELVHPWALNERIAAPNAQSHSQPSPLRIGVVHAAAHARWPWSLQRWQFVITRMHAVCDVVFIGDIAQLAQCTGWPARQHVAVQSTLFEGYREVLPRIATVQPALKLFAQPDKFCTSFSQFYERAQRVQPDFAKLLMP